MTKLAMVQCMYFAVSYETEKAEEDQRQLIYTVKGETQADIRGRNGRSKRHREVASNRPGPKLNKRIGVNISMLIQMCVVHAILHFCASFPLTL